MERPSQNIQIIHHNEILALKNKAKKEETTLSFTQKFHTSYPYLATFLSFCTLFFAMSLAVSLLINSLIWAVGYDVTTVAMAIMIITVQTIGAFYVFKYVVQKHLLPYVKA